MVSWDDAVSTWISKSAQQTLQMFRLPICKRESPLLLAGPSFLVLSWRVSPWFGFLVSYPREPSLLLSGLVLWYSWIWQRGVVNCWHRKRKTSRSVCAAFYGCCSAPAFSITLLFLLSLLSGESLILFLALCGFCRMRAKFPLIGSSSLRLFSNSPLTWCCSQPRLSRF